MFRRLQEIKDTKLTDAIDLNSIDQKGAEIKKIFDEADTNIKQHKVVIDVAAKVQEAQSDFRKANEPKLLDAANKALDEGFSPLTIGLIAAGSGIVTLFVLKYLPDSVKEKLPGFHASNDPSGVGLLETVPGEIAGGVAIGALGAVAKVTSNKVQKWRKDQLATLAASSISKEVKILEDVKVVQIEEGKDTD